MRQENSLTLHSFFVRGGIKKPLTKIEMDNTKLNLVKSKERLTFVQVMSLQSSLRNIFVHNFLKTSSKSNLFAHSAQTCKTKVFSLPVRIFRQKIYLITKSFSTIPTYPALISVTNQNGALKTRLSMQHFFRQSIYNQKSNFDRFEFSIKYNYVLFFLLFSGNPLHFMSL